MNDDETFVLDHAQGNKSPLAVILAVVKTREHLAFEDKGGIENIDLSLFYNFLPLVLVPFEFQHNSPRIE